MAYTHTQYGVRMDGQTASSVAGASGDPLSPTVGTRFGGPVYGMINGAGSLSVTYDVAGFGSHQWQPACIPHRVVRVGAETSANLTNPQELIFSIHPRAGSAAGEAFRFMLPTNTATGFQTVKTVTSYVVVTPGQRLRAAVSTAIGTVAAKIYLWVEPVWEEVANVTDAQSPTA